FVELARLAVAHEHHAVRALQHEPARGVVIDLAGDGVELEPRREPGDLAEIDREEIEEEGAVGLGRERYHAPTPRLRHAAVDVMQVRRLPRPPRAVVD